MLLSAVSVLVVAQSSSEIPEGLMNNPVFLRKFDAAVSFTCHPAEGQLTRQLLQQNVRIKVCV